MATYTDTFTEGSNIDLATHTPDSGGAWTMSEQTNTTSVINVQAADDTASPTVNTNGSAGVPPRIIYTVDWTPDNANYDVSFTIDAVSAGDDGAGVVARWADSSNYYVAMLDGSDAAILAKVVGGTRTVIDGPEAVTAAATDVWKFELRGTTLKFYQNGVERCSASDGALTAKGVVGIGFGALGTTETDDINTSWDITDFILEDAAAGEEIMADKWLPHVRFVRGPRFKAVASGMTPPQKVN
jgi:hypothetical protein